MKLWLELTGITANEAAKKADITVSSIYNFLNGDTKSLRSDTLAKLAKAYCCRVDDILNGCGPNSTPSVAVIYRVGAKGRLFPCEDNLLAIAPPAISLPLDIRAALIDGDGLLPIPDQWTVFFRTEAASVEKLSGKLACVRFRGGGDKLVIRKIIASNGADYHSLVSMDGKVTEDVEIVLGHEVIAFALAKIVAS